MIYKQEAKFRELAKLLSSYDCIFMDTCSLMEEAFPGFMEDLAVLQNDDYWNEQITVLKQCVDELKKHAKSKENGKRIDAKCALKILRNDRWHTHIIKIEKSIKKETHFVDQILFNLVNEYRRNKRILVITQDKQLAYDLRSLNHLGSQRGRPVDVYKLRPDSSIEPNYGADENGIRPDFKERKNTQKFEKTPQKSFKNKGEEPKTSQRDEPIVLEDRRLSANLRNPNYDKSRKIEDINAQIARLSLLSEKERNAFPLAFTLSQLEEEKTKLGDNAKTLPSREEAKAKASLAPKKEEKKEAQKPIPAPMKKETQKVIVPLPAEKEEPVKKSWTEKGRNASFALERLGEHHGWLFRDPSIPFVKGVHGDYDLVSTDLAKIDAFASSMKEGEKRDFLLKSLSIHIEKDKLGYILSKNEASPSFKKEEPLETAKKETPSKPSLVKEAKTAPKAAIAPKEAASSRPKKKTTPKAVPSKGEEAEAEGPKKAAKKTVSRKEPAKKSPKKALAPKAEKEAKKTVNQTVKKTSLIVKTKTIVSSDGNAVVPTGVTLSAGEPAPKKRKTAKNKPQTLEEKNAFEASKKKEEGAKLHRLSLAEDAPKKKARKGPSPDYEKAKKNDQLLKANINNPTYSIENKIRDIEAQLLLLKGLKKKEADSLLLSVSVLEARLKELR